MFVFCVCFVDGGVVLYFDVFYFCRFINFYDGDYVFYNVG